MPFPASLIAVLFRHELHFAVWIRPVCLFYSSLSLGWLPWLSNMVIQFRPFPGTYERTVQIDSLKSNRKGKLERGRKASKAIAKNSKQKRQINPKESRLSAVRWSTHTYRNIHTHTVLHTCGTYKTHNQEKEKKFAACGNFVGVFTYIRSGTCFE